MTRTPVGHGRSPEQIIEDSYDAYKRGEVTETEMTIVHLLVSILLELRHRP